MFDRTRNNMAIQNFHYGKTYNDFTTLCTMVYKLRCVMMVFADLNGGLQPRHVDWLASEKGEKYKVVLGLLLRHETFWAVDHTKMRQWKVHFVRMA